MIAAMHPVVPEEIMALLDGELTPSRNEYVSLHFKDCTTCREVVDSLGATSKILGTWTVAVALDAPELESQLCKAAGQNRSADSQFLPKNTLSGLLRRYWPLTAAGAILAVGFVLILSRPRMAVSVDNASTIHLRERLKYVAPSRPIVDQQSKVTTLMSPGVVADSNGLLHGLGDHAQNSVSIDGQPIAGPMIARTASLSIIAKDFVRGRATLDAIVARHSGYTASLTINTPQSAGRSLQASLRIPVTQLNAALAELKTLGYVEMQTQGGEEVTQQHADLVARLKISRETERRFLAILKGWSGDINQALTTEQAIARVRGEIEQMEAEQKNLEHRVDFATVDLSLSEEYKAQLGAPASISTRFHNALVKGIRSAQEMIVDIALFCAEVGPSLVIWAVILLPVGWFFWRRWRRSYGLVSSALL
jgi:anti-sigma factor RsiW